MGEPEVKKPSMLQIMRMASSKDFQKDIENTQTQLNHGHAMLAELFPAEHERVHASCLQPDLRKKMGDMIANGAENGLCMYRMIGLQYARKFGLDGYNLSKSKFPGVE